METKFCKCGCGAELDFSKGSKKKNFLKGHAARINNVASKARKGKPPWNKGIPRSDEEKEKMSLNIKKSYEKGTRKQYIKTPEHKEKLREAAKKPKSKETIEKIIKARENNPNYENSKKQISETLKQKYKNKEIASSFYIDGRYKNDPLSDYNLYNGQFTQELKKEVRQRDNWTCQKCGKKRSAVCHHIDEDKSNNIIDNLIILCKNCHAKYHSIKDKRSKDIEKELFLEILQKRKIYERSSML